MSQSVRYRIEHHTCYRYPEPVAICQNQLRMIPRDFAHVRCHHVETDIQPRPDAVQRHHDYYGNCVLAFAVESLHHQLDVSVRSEVTVTDNEVSDDAVAWDQVAAGVADGSDPNWLAAGEFCYDSPRIVCDQADFAAYARSSFPGGRPILEAVSEFTKRIHDDFKYDPTVTDVHTSTGEAFQLRAGVCQDFAHVQIACLRSLGIPARYVSGYLRTVPPPGKPKLVGADESHAWVSVYCGQQIGWVEFDPTNACMTNLNHIPICIGRDYSEVTPMRGVVLGGGKTQLTVSVDVEEVTPRR